MRKPFFQDVEVFQKQRDTRPAEAAFGNKQSPEPHLDLKAAPFEWHGLKAAEHCSAFGTRDYTAKLKNLAWRENIKWRQACENTPITVHGESMKPTTCERKWPMGEIIGYWSVNFGEPDCMAEWGTFTDKGCIQKGKSKLRHFQSRLWNIKAGEDWMTICTTAPARIRDVSFEKPTMCEDQGLWGVYGSWDVEDESCK